MVACYQRFRVQGGKAKKAEKPGKTAGLSPADKDGSVKPKTSGSDKPAKECKKSKVCNCDDKCDPGEAKNCPAWKR